MSFPSSATRFALASLAFSLTIRPASGRAEGTTAAPTLEQGREVLQESDRYRGGVHEGGQWRVELVAKEGGTERTSRYLVKAKGVNALVECESPPKNRGELMLFEDRMLWFYRPSLRRPIGLSPRQRLIGQAANGDIAATNYARDYEVTSIAGDQVDGQAAWRLDLKARAANATYDRVRYWIRKRDRLGTKAEFLTVQGEVFKWATFTYDNHVTVGNKRLPFVSKMVITNAGFSDDVTTIVYSSPEVRPVSDSTFNVNALSR